MSWWSDIFSGGDESTHSVDYYAEGVQLLRSGHYHEAVTSFRLALRENPTDSAVLQQIAIAYTRIGMTEEAARTYRTVLQHDARASGAHYGLAFLLLREGNAEEATSHLRSFLEFAPRTPEASRHIEHARTTLRELAGRPERE
ncbi:MAG TPA: tetratricopeptide repeat protein [Longimicrobiales bacterium]|nr:tetratricopeptide repeat protein [Longimicrobiales bacterium]